MENSVFYIRLKADISNRFEIYRIKGNHLKLWFNILFLSFIWIVAIFAICTAPFIYSKDDPNISKYLFMTDMVFLPLSALMSFWMYGCTSWIKIKHNAWFLHKLYLTSKYRYIYGEDVFAFGSFLPKILPVHNTKIFAIKDHVKNYSLIGWIYKRNPALAIKLMRYSVSSYMILLGSGVLLELLSFILVLSFYLSH